MRKVLMEVVSGIAVVYIIMLAMLIVWSNS